MRLKILFNTSKLPILYRHRFMALIKEALRISDETYKQSLYPDKDSEKSKVVKPFTFAVALPPGRVPVKERIVIDEDVEVDDIVFYFPENSRLSFYVASFDYQFVINLYNGLLEMQSFRFGSDITLRFEKAFIVNEKRINSDEVTFITSVPILIEEKNEKPILPLGNDQYSMNKFNDSFNAIHDRILGNIRGFGLRKEMEFTPVRLKKQVVKHTLKGFRKKTGKPYMTLTCFEGYFKLKGDPSDLQMLYQIGIGLRTGQGFGMVDVM